MLIFYLISFIINLAIFAGFMYRYRETSAKAYLHIGLAVLAEAIAAAILAFLGDMIFDSFIVSLVIIYAAAIVGSLAGLVMVMVVLQQLRVWIESMRTGTAPQVNRLDKSEQISKYLRIAYPVLTLLSILFYVLLIVSLGFAAILSIVVAIAFTVAVVTQCAIIVWMYLDLHNQGAGNESELRKRNQLLKLAGLTFFGAWPAMLSGVGAGVGGIVVWWVWYGIALWPGALLGFEEPVQAANAGNKYAPGVASPYGTQPAGDYSQAPAYSQQPPQAAYQPQYQQQYGGQPAYQPSAQQYAQ